ncbi:MAG: NAD(P)H-hydrate dehydratase [Proteobacteria bacterium]|nr:NAD(P)H-hydrate dehydratase [Pseudomonadota bacterium]
MSTRLYTAAQVRELDRHAIEDLGIAGFDLMQRAASAAWRVLCARWPRAQRLAVLCGAGNNGGDGYLLACQARAAGLPTVVLALAEPASDAARRARDAWREAGGHTLVFEQGLPAADVYVDAIFGTGLARPVEGAAAQTIRHLNATGKPVLALDVPSGIDADTGMVQGVAVRAQMTVSFIARKRGLATGAALDACGTLVLDRLGLSEEALANAPYDARLLNPRRLATWLPPRARDAHKGDFGHVLAIGGDAGMGGAIRLCAEAALRVGAGLVSAATRPEHVAAINGARPEVMACAVADAASLSTMLDRASVLALGPGLGRSPWSEALWRAALAARKPAVVDADALNLLADKSLVLPGCVITPHPGEAARLLGVQTPAIERDRFAAARELATRFRCVAVLKGAGSLIAHDNGDVAVCPWGNPGMASGGMGDVLTGVIAGLMAQGLNAWRAARLGVAVHAQAGDAAARDGEAGTVAGDLFAHLRRLRNGLADG